MMKIHNLRESTLAKMLSAIVVMLTLFNVNETHGQGPGFRGGRGQGGTERGQGNSEGAGPHDERHDADREVFHFLLTHHEKIKRTVKEIDHGVETLTESDDPEISSKLKEHVKWMSVRIKEASPIRMRDPLFAEIFKHTDKIKLTHEETEKGIKVVETSEDAYVVKLIQAHAKVVSGFVERGFDEAMRNHPIPDGKQTTNVSKTLLNPVIAEYGAVVQLPKAAHQPRKESKVLVDITRGGNPEELNSAIEKVAKYLNIYAGGGKAPAKAKFAIIFHGDATLAVLNNEAYAAKFKTKDNPNLDLLRQFHEQGVELYVCGQTLLSNDAKPEDVAVFVDTAVSALTVVVNLQEEGFAHISLGK
jgi:intracellular sulfur oxidation DsrE/DsrF family protein